MDKMDQVLMPTTTAEQLDAQQLQRLCRLCLGPDQDISVHDIATRTEPKSPPSTYAELAESVLDIRIYTRDERTATLICMECAYNLRLLHKFRTKCRAANGRISELITDTDEKTQLLSAADDLSAYSKQSPPAIDNDRGIHIKSPEAHIIIEDDSGAEAAADDDNDHDEPIIEEYLLDKTATDTQSTTDGVDADDDAAPAENDYDDDDGVDESAASDDNDDEATSRRNSSTCTDFDYLLVDPAGADCCPDTNPPPADVVAAVVPPQRRFVCEQCGRAFARKFTLDQHRRTHTGATPFACAECAKRFTRASHLEAHRRIHRNVRPFACDRCERSFTKSSDLLRHRHVHDGRRDFACPQCAKRFKRAADVRLHMHVHTGEKRFRCEAGDGCGKAYTSYSSLKKHRLRWHSAEAATAASVQEIGEDTDE